MNIMRAIPAIVLLAACAATQAAENPTLVRGRKPAPWLDHVFVIVLENHSYADIRGNPFAPFINQWADGGAAVATAYSATTHPSLPNYLALVGGSDFNVSSDNSPDWHSRTCTPFTDDGAVCPLADTGSDTTGTRGIVGRNIGDQLLVHGQGWKNYEQHLPPEGADAVDFSDGMFSNRTDFSAMLPDATTTSDDMAGYIPHLYAVKHNPFVYFKSGQNTAGLQRQAGFDGNDGLFADLRAGTVPNLSFIVPDQCNDEHGVGGSDAFCAYEPTLIQRSDKTVARIVSAIKSSPAWLAGNNAIVLVWDEDDYGESNQVLLLVDTSRGNPVRASATPYNHYSLLKTLETGFGLPCLNHACDTDVNAMLDLFGGLVHGTRLHVP